MEAGFLDINVSHVYFAKKTIRKVLRITNKYIRFVGSKQAEAELLIRFCSCLKTVESKIEKNPALNNLYQNQIKKIDKAMDGLHEDLQYDLRKKLAFT